MSCCYNFHRNFIYYFHLTCLQALQLLSNFTLSIPLKALSWCYCLVRTPYIQSTRSLYSLSTDTAGTSLQQPCCNVDARLFYTSHWYLHKSFKWLVVGVRNAGHFRLRTPCLPAFTSHTPTNYVFVRAMEPAVRIQHCCTNLQT